MPKGLAGLQAAVQPMTGESSIDAALAALSPDEQAMVLQGIDPFADGGPITQTTQGYTPPQPEPAPSTISPEQRMQLHQALMSLMETLSAPGNESDMLVGESIRNAIMALEQGL